MIDYEDIGVWNRIILHTNNFVVEWKIYVACVLFMWLSPCAARVMQVVVLWCVHVRWSGYFGMNRELQV